MSTTSYPHAHMRMSVLDRAFYLLDSARSSQDFTVILHLDDSPSIDSFYAGARSAMNLFPTSASCIRGKDRVWRENKSFKLEFLSTTSEGESRAAIEKFINDRFDLRRQPPVRQAVISNGSGAVCLATRFHHSAADGVSAAIWLGHQLNVAYGIETAQLERAPFAGVLLRRLQTSVRRSQFAFDGACHPLRTSSSKRSGLRRWHTINFPAVDLQKACRHAGGFTYNDLLATCALETLSHWTNCRDGKGKIGLWLPVNVRREHNAGFGNGTSRIRVYARYDANASFTEKCREVRRQVSWTSKHGEWVVPEMPWVNHLPAPIIGPLLRNYLELPSVDMATAVFTHAGSWIANAGEAFRHVRQIECVGLLHSRQNLAMNAATHQGQTWLTLTCDSASLRPGDVQELGRIYEQQIAVARKELL
jgi:NRPS condensation-like uncharacterized protein